MHTYLWKAPWHLTKPPENREIFLFTDTEIPLNLGIKNEENEDIETTDNCEL